MIQSFNITLPPLTRGAHLITNDILDKVGSLPANGLLNLFVRHTSAGITINENADPSVRKDLAKSLDELVKEDEPYYTHTMEGSDDMPAHIKSTLVGTSITIPIQGGKLALGTWQGIYFCEFRNHASNRVLIATIYS